MTVNEKSRGFKSLPMEVSFISNDEDNDHQLFLQHRNPNPKNLKKKLQSYSFNKRNQFDCKQDLCNDQSNTTYSTISVTTKSFVIESSSRRFTYIGDDIVPEVNEDISEKSWKKCGLVSNAQKFQIIFDVKLVVKLQKIYLP